MSNDKDRVLFFSATDLFFANGQGVYAKNVLKQIAGNLDAEKSERIFMAPRPEDEKHHKELESISDKVIWLPKKKRRDVLRHLWIQCVAVYYILKVSPKTIVFSVKPNMVSVVVAGWFRKFKKVVLVEGDGGRTLKTLGGPSVVYLGEMIFKRIFKTADSIFVAYSSALSWVEKYNKKCHKEIIPCGVDTSLFIPTKDKKNVNLNSICIGYVGSFRPVQRLDFLLDILASNETYTACLIGDGVERDRIEQYAKSIGVEDRVAFLGVQEQKDIPSLIENCNLMWAYTDVAYWGVPIKAYEYLSCNKYIVARDLPEFQFVKHKGFGFLLENDSVHEFAQKLDQFKVDSASSNRSSSHEYICQNYTWENFRKVSAYVY